MPTMSERDARSLGRATLEELRRLAVCRVLAGESQVVVAASLEVTPFTVNRWMRTYREHGEAGLAARKAPGRPTKLTTQQQAKLRRIIIGKDPRQLNFGSALWTLSIVGQVVEQLFEVVLHASSISRMLHGMGITPQKPVRRAFARDDEECRTWMRVEFPKIVENAHRRQAALLFLDETGVHEDGPIGRSWAERGRPPVVKVTGRRNRVNVISAISPQGRLWFRCFQGTLTAGRFVDFLAALLKGRSKPVDLILDKHPAHTAAMTRRFLAERTRQIRVHFLPSYAPDLNPDEHVWSYLKGTFRSDPMTQDEDLTLAVLTTMSAIQQNHTLVRSFFDDPAVQYVKEALGW